MQRSLLSALLWAASFAATAPAFAWTTTPALNPANGHYYAFFTGLDDERYIRPAMPFADALARAASMSHLGIPGHLATITSQAEQDFVYDYFLQFVGPPRINRPFEQKELFWIAASDAAVEGEWRWVAGPETGQLFWQGASDGQALGYQNWTYFRGQRQEPNDFAEGTRPVNPAGEDAVALNLYTNPFSDWLNVWWNDVSTLDDRLIFVPRLGIVEFSPIPEPSSVALIGSAFIAIFAARRCQFR